MDIYYDPTQPVNAYLNGQTYPLGNGGVLAPAVPEPSIGGLLALTGAGLLARRRARKVLRV